MCFRKMKKKHLTERIGFLFLILAIVIPIVVVTIAYFSKMNRKEVVVNNEKSVESLNFLEVIMELSSVGDFIGGTTVTFLTVANVMFFLRTIYLQKDQLAKANQQFVITDETMKRQNFETQFYNLIGLLKESKIHNNGKFRIDVYDEDGMEKTTKVINDQMEQLITFCEKYRYTENESQMKDFLREQDDVETNVDKLIQKYFLLNRSNVIKLYLDAKSIKQSDRTDFENDYYRKFFDDLSMDTIIEKYIANSPVEYFNELLKLTALIEGQIETYIQQLNDNQVAEKELYTKILHINIEREKNIVNYYNAKG